MSSMISNLPNRISNGIDWAGRGIFKQFLDHAPGAPAVDKAVRLHQVQIVLPTIATLLFLYDYGKQQAAGSNGDPNHGTRILTESALAYLLLENTKGFYPVLALGLAAVKAGQQPTRLGKIKAVVNTLTVLGMGWAGIQLGKSLSGMQVYHENRHLLDALQAETKDKKPITEVQDFFAKYHSHEHPLKDKLADLHKNLKALQEKWDKLYKDTDFLNTLKRDLLGEREILPFKLEIELKEDIKFLRDAAETTKTELYDHYLQMLETLPEAGQKAVRNDILSNPHLNGFMQSLKVGQAAHVKFSRFMNPILGFALLGGLLGTVFARKMNRGLSHRYPHLDQIRHDTYTASHGASGSNGSAHGDGGHGGGGSNWLPHLLERIP